MNWTCGGGAFPEGPPPPSVLLRVSAYIYQIIFKGE
jgi:hypothetical protein